MLSQKLQDDLITAYQKVYEEKRGHAAGDSDDTEKQASQLASDVRYKAKGKVKPKVHRKKKREKVYHTDTWCITSTTGSEVNGETKTHG